MRDWFDIFFIPIFPYNTEYHLVCPHCESALGLEDGDTIETLKEIAELFGEFEEKEITEKELEKGYKKLVKKL